MTTEERKAILTRAAQQIKSFGYRAYIVKDKPSGLIWGVFTDGKVIAGVDVDGFGFISVGTRHKPCTGCGTGFRVQDELLPSEITEDICRQAVSMCPSWYRDSLKGVVKWTPEEFFKTEREKWNNEYEEV